jgi:hydrogenase maturation protease
MNILFYAYGNPGRQDDALGISFCDAIEEWVKAQNLPNISFDSNYQLNIEDADAIAGYDLVFFADASIEPINDFIITEVQAADAQIEFTMHAISPGVVLNLCNDIYPGKVPNAFLVHIKGYEWDLEFDKGLSPQAEVNLKKVLDFTKQEILNSINLPKAEAIKYWQKIADSN